jgi:hypothetical protein
MTFHDPHSPSLPSTGDVGLGYDSQRTYVTVARVQVPACQFEQYTI